MKPIVIPFDPGAVEDPVTVVAKTPQELINVHESDEVAVCLLADGDWVLQRFELHTGYDSDTVARFSREGRAPERDGSLEMMGRFKSDRAQLFTETFGESELVLEHVNTKRVILKVPIRVIPKPERTKLMEATVRELIKIAPQTIISNVSGQNKSIVDDDWHVGTASFAFPEMELSEIERLTGRIFPLLFYIRHSPAYKVNKKAVLLPLFRVRKLSRRGLLQITRFNDQALLEDRRVESTKAVKSNDVLAHEVIKSFLCKLLRRLNRLQGIATENIESCEKDIAGIKARSGEAQYVMKFELENVERHCETARLFERRIDEQKKKLACALELDYLVGVDESGRTVFSVSRTEFVYNRQYARVYDLVRDFELKHFWWIPLTEGRGMVHGFKESRRNNSLQRKYSMLYEYWCCWRLIHAFEQVGFDFGDAKASLRGHLARSIIVGNERRAFATEAQCRSRDGLVLQIIHDYAAYSKGIVPESDFSTIAGARYDKNGVLREGSAKDLETPDFALVFTNVKTGWWQWIVMDAKSSSSLRAGQVYKQSNYFLQRHRSKHRGEQKSPWQSWLIYSGGSDSTCGLEFLSDSDILDYRWKREDRGDIQAMVEGINNEAACSEVNGIEFDASIVDSKRFAGEVRGNAITTSIDDPVKDPFLKFAKIQMRTIARYMRG